jgi:oxygen-dependent protoporphyrinogen oxidase
VQTEHSAVVYAGTAFGLSKLGIRAHRPVNVSSFANIHYPPVASVVLGFRREDVAHPLDGFGMLIPRLEGFRILGSIFSSSLFPNRAPAGHVTLTSYIGGARSPELARKNPEELFDATLEDLRALLLISGAPTFKHHVLYPQAIPQYNLGYERFRNLMARTETESPGLFFAGHFRDGISVSDCIVSGEKVAGRIANHLADVRMERPSSPLKNPAWMVA